MFVEIVYQIFSITKIKKIGNQNYDKYFHKELITMFIQNVYRFFSNFIAGSILRFIQIYLN